MSRQYCRFCDQDFVSGRACRDKNERNRCAEWSLRQPFSIRETFEEDISKSAPVYEASHNSGEGDLSVMPDYAGADTSSKPRPLAVGRINAFDEIDKLREDLSALALKVREQS